MQTFSQNCSPMCVQNRLAVIQVGMLMGEMVVDVSLCSQLSWWRGRGRRVGGRDLAKDIFVKE